MSVAHALQTGMVDNAARSAKTVVEIILFMGRGISLLTNIIKKYEKRHIGDPKDKRPGR